MAREIKFRGRNILNNDWMYGDLIHDDEHCSVYVYPRDAGPLELQHRVDADTIGQFTGLHDKYGKEIYDGDIVYIRMNDGSDCNCVIGYDIDNLAFGIMDEYAYRSMLDGYKRDYDNGSMHRLYKDSRIFEVIGNIYDNPELLKED